MKSALHVVARGFANRRRGSLLSLCRTLLALHPKPISTAPVAPPVRWLCLLSRTHARYGTAHRQPTALGGMPLGRTSLTALNVITLSLSGCGFGGASRDVSFHSPNHHISCRKSLAVDRRGACLTCTLIVPQFRGPSSCPDTIGKSALKTIGRRFHRAAPAASFLRLYPKHSGADLNSAPRHSSAGPLPIEI